MENNSLKNEVIRAQDVLKQIQMRFTAEYQLNANVLEEIKIYKQKLQCMENERNQSLLEIEKHLNIIAKTNEELQQRLNNETNWLCDADEDISQINSDKKENNQPNQIETKNLENVSATYALQMNENVPNYTNDGTSSNLEKYLQDLYQELCTRVQDQQEQAKKIRNEPSVELAAIKALLDEGDKRLQRLSAKNKGNWTKDDEATSETLTKDQVSSSEPFTEKLEDFQKVRSQVSFQLPIQEGWVDSKTSIPTMQTPTNESFPVAKETTDNSCEVSLTNSSPPEESSKIETPIPRPVGPIQPPSSPADQMNQTGCFEEKFSGKGKDYFEEMFSNNKDLFSFDQDYKTGKHHVSKTSPPHLFQEYNATTSSAIGNLCILEINEEGKFVRLYNSDRKDTEIGNYMIKQNVSSHPVIVFRFPPRTKFPRNSIITIWAASCDNDVFHNPPSNYIWDEQIKWGVGREFTTILCKPNGQAIAWTNAAHKFNPQLTPQIPMTPIHVRTMQRMTPASPIEMKPSCRNEMALNVRNSTQAWEKNLVFLRREKYSPTPVMCIRHPHGLSPGNMVHPSVGKERNEKWSSRVSTPIDIAEPKKSLPRKTFTKRCSNVNGRSTISQPRHNTDSKNSFNKSHSPKSEVDHLLSCAAFMKPTTRLRYGLQLIRAQHNMTYNPPMPKLSRSAW